MRKGFFIGFVLIVTMHGAVLHAADIEIEDAPLDDATSVAHLPTISVPSDIADYRLQTRLYTIAALDYAHIKSTASTVMVNNGLISARSGRQELNGEVLYKPSPRLTLKGDMQAQYSTAYATATPLYAKGSQDWLKLNEAFVQYYATNATSMLAGKYRRVFGPGVFQNPMDRHNPVNALPGQPLQREGSFLVQASWEHSIERGFVSDVSVSVGILPRFYLGKNGLPSKDASVIHFDSTKPLNQSIERIPASWSPSRSGGFIRLYGNVYSGDANIVYYRAESQSQWGLSYARYAVPWLELHAESLYYTTRHDELLTTERNNSYYFDYLAGARVEYDQNIGVTVEYLYQDEQPDIFSGDEKLQRALIVSTLNTDNHRLFITPLRRYLLASLYSRNMRDMYSITCNVIYGIAQEDIMASIRGEMKVASHAQLAVTGSVIAGNETSFYGAAIPNDYRVTSELEIVF